MKYIYPALLSAVSLFSNAYAAGNECDETLSSSRHQCERIVGSLRPDKAGQMRVFASDGSEFTAGQAQWMKGQLKLVVEACDHGDSAEANRVLTEVQRMLSEHHRGA
jgi:hypothetical protein